MGKQAKPSKVLQLHSVASAFSSLQSAAGQEIPPASSKELPTRPRAPNSNKDERLKAQAKDQASQRVDSKGLSAASLFKSPAAAAVELLWLCAGALLRLDGKGIS